MEVISTSEYANKQLFELRQESENGNLEALCELGKRYLQSTNWTDKAEGASKLRQVIKQTNECRNGEVDIDLLANAYVYLGEYYQSILGVYGPELESIIRSEKSL